MKISGALKARNLLIQLATNFIHPMNSRCFVRIVYTAAKAKPSDLLLFLPGFPPAFRLPACHIAAR